MISLSALSVAIACLTLLACPTPTSTGSNTIGNNNSPSYSPVTYSGQARFTLNAATTSTIKMAAFHTPNGASSETMVSDVANLGNAANTPFSFNLAINFQNITPGMFDYFNFKMWRDDNGNSLLDGAESNTYVWGDSGDTVFGSGDAVYFEFCSNMSGVLTWYLNKAQVQPFVTVTNSVKTGLRLKSNGNL